MKKLCDRCGSSATKEIGSAHICRACHPELTAEIESMREAGKPVNAIQIARKYFKANHSGGNYLLRDVPRGISDKLRMTAAAQNTNQRAVVLAALVNYLK